MQEISNERLSDILRAACDDAARHVPSGLHYVSSALKEMSSKEHDDPIGALIVGLDYHFRSYPEERDERGPFGPMMESGDRVYPKLLAELPDEVLEVWAQAVPLSPLGTVGARYADVLWERGFGDEAHRWARAAIDLYVQGLDERFDHPHVLMEMARRAYELARILNDPGLGDVTVAKMTELVRWSLEEGSTPGVALPLLELLADQQEPAAELGELVDGAIETYGNDPWHLESALEIKSKLISSEEEKRSLQETQVVAFRDLARSSEGIARYSHLQRALEMANVRGLKDLADELRAEIEGISEEDLDLMEISTEISIPNEEIDSFISQIVGDDELRSALTRFGVSLPLGDEQKSLDFVEEMFRAHPLQAIIPRMTLGAENAMIRKAEDEDEQRRAAVTDYETRLVSFHGHLCVETLAGIKSRYGSIDSWLDAPMIEPVVVEKILSALGLYEQGQFDAAASMLIPRIERAIRSIARQLGFPVTGRQHRDGRLSEVKSLWPLLDTLKLALRDATHRYLKLLLVDQTSFNLRNRISHGLVDEAAQADAALLIHAACHLSVLQPEPVPALEGQ